MPSRYYYPKYIICDKGQQFWCSVFKDWCDRHGITPRFGAVGQHGSIALIARFILSLRNECMRRVFVPLRSETFHWELTLFEKWFNQARPHSSLNGKTPYEADHDVLPACERPRYEPRSHWSPATVALPFALMCAIIGGGSTCRSLS